MLHTLRNFTRNLAAGLRLAFFQPVDRLDFRIDAAQLVLLLLLSAAIDFGGDYLRAGPEREFSLYGAGSELLGTALLLAGAAIVSMIFRQRQLLLAIPVIAMAGLALPQAANYLPSLTQGGTPIRVLIAFWGGQLILLWLIAILVRSVYVAFAPPPGQAWLKAIAGGMLLASPIWFSSLLHPVSPWWEDGADEVALAPGMNAGSEAVLAAQTFLFEQALENLKDERPGETDLYFVGFAPYGRQNVFRKDVEAARRVMDSRWGTEGRSILLLNDRATLLSAPFATVTNLRETLQEIGAAIDTDNDVVMVYLASHGSRDHRISADLPPLSLVELTPQGLKQLLDEAGIKWRIVIVSACYSGGFLPVLADANTIVIAAAQADRQSFGCGDDSESTFFGEAMFQHGLAKHDTIAAAFEAAKQRVAERETSGGYTPPSNPQIAVGAAIAAKLPSLRLRGGGGVTARLAVHPGAS